MSTQRVSAGYLPGLAREDVRWEVLSFESAAGRLEVEVPVLGAQQMQALARRVTFGLGRTGTTGSHFSGDLFLAVSTGNPGALTPGGDVLFGRARDRLDRLEFVPWGVIDPFYAAVAHATEEAVLNALVANKEMVGYMGRRVPGLPRAAVARTPAR